MKTVVKTILKILLGILAAIILILVGVAVNMFLVGEELYPHAMTFYDVTLTDDEIHVEGNLIGYSAVAYKGYKYRIEDNCVYIKLNGVLVSSIYKYGVFDIKIKGDFSDIERICVEGKGEEKMILPMEESLFEISTDWGKPEEGATDMVKVSRGG